jgi:hypothetical protein
MLTKLGKRIEDLNTYIVALDRRLVDQERLTTELTFWKDEVVNMFLAQLVRSMGPNGPTIPELPIHLPLTIRKYVLFYRNHGVLGFPDDDVCLDQPLEEIHLCRRTARGQIQRLFGQRPEVHFRFRPL